MNVEKVFCSEAVDMNLHLRVVEELLVKIKPFSKFCQLQRRVRKVSRLSPRGRRRVGGHLPAKGSCRDRSRHRCEGEQISVVQICNVIPCKIHVESSKVCRSGNVLMP